jgi:fatty acid amide hydrolase
VTKDEIILLGAAELAAKIAAGEITAREAVDAHIARIEAVNAKINAVVVQRYDEARAEAEAADASRAAGKLLGPLHGVPITIKEQFTVAGTPATLGVPGAASDTTDGPLVARLRAAGAIILGKTNVPQLLIYNETDNPVYGRTNNPWNLARSSGGSSGGEAAIIAAYGSPLGLGSDIGGSLRTPSHACGIAALKPTSGRLTNEDARPAAYATGQIAILNQAGPMARNVADLTLAMRVLAAPGQERIDSTVPPVPWSEPDDVDVSTLRIGVYDDDGYFASSPSVRRAVHDAALALAARGAKIEPFTPPDVPRAIALFFEIIGADGGRGAKRRLGSAPRDVRVNGLFQLEGIPRRLRPFLVAAARIAGQGGMANSLAHIKPAPSTDAFWSLVEAQATYRRRFIAALDELALDAILAPPHALPALTHGSSYYLSGASSYAMLYNLLGLPAGVVPVTRVRDDETSSKRGTIDTVEKTARAVEKGSAGLPLGVQVIARHWREDIVLAAMAAIEAQVRDTPTYPRLDPTTA